MKSVFIYLVLIFSVFEIYLTLKTHTHTHTHTHTSTNTNMNSNLKAKFRSNVRIKKAINQVKVNPQQNIPKAINLPTLANDIPVEDIDLGPGPIYWNGWIKFLKYKNSSHESNLDNKPKSFYENNEYYKQMSDNSTLNTTKFEGGTYKFIKDPFHFYALLMNDTINIVSSREQKYEKTIEIINIETIENVKETNKYEGGIEDFGNFAEGFCLKIKADINLSENFVYIICANSVEEKTVFMSLLRKIKINKQRQKGLIFSDVLKPPEIHTINEYIKLDQENQFCEGELISDKMNVKAGQIDGYWVIIHPWTQCNLKCGGGNSTLQRLCVPPHPGGKDCEGPDVIVRKCNNFPCPEIKYYNSLIKNITLPPIYKTMPFSNRPQRNSICRVKESDMVMTRNVQDVASSHKIVSKVQVPVRVVMNNRTITLFGNDEYDSIVLSFNIRKTKFAISQLNNHCFILSDIEIKDKQTELCPFGYTDDDSTVKQWENDFNTFQQKCYYELPIKDSMMRELEHKLEEKIRDAKEEVALERENTLHQKLQLKTEAELDLNLRKTNEMALNVIKKELTLQELIKKEEDEREKQEQAEIKNEIQKEERKGKLLMKAINEKVIEDQFNFKAKEKETEIEEVKQDLATEVARKRSELKQMITFMRKSSQRKKMTLKSRLIGVRMKLVDEMNSAYKKGDAKYCAITHIKDRDAYCQVNFGDQVDRYSLCKSSDFCYICCENEFGEALIEYRQQCNKEICSKVKITDTEEEITVESIKKIKLQNPPKLNK